MKKVSGIIPAVSTIVDASENVNEKSMRSIVRACIEKKMHGVFVCGTNGEGLTLTQKEREKAIAIALDEAKDEILILAGCMDTSTRRVIDNIKMFEQLGGKYSVVTPTVYTRHGSHKEALLHFEKISKAVDSDFLVYNIPPYVGYNIPRSTVFEIANFEHIIGYKDTSGNFVDFIAYVEHFKNTDFAIFQGMTTLVGPSILIGGDGFIPNVGPVIPECCTAIYEAAKSGDVKKTMEYQTILTQMIQSFGGAENAITACKVAYSLRGFGEDLSCLPHYPADEALRKSLEETLKDIDSKLVKLLNS